MKNEIVIKFDYCGLCPYLGQRIFIDDYPVPDDYVTESVIYCTHYHGIGMRPVVRKLTREEYDNIPRWCPLIDEGVG